MLSAHKPASLLHLPEMATSCPRPCICWGCSLAASRQPSSLCPTWPIPVHGRALAGAAPSSQASICLPAAPRSHFLPTVMHSLGLLPLHQPASLFPLPEMAHSRLQSCPGCSCSLIASRHTSSLTMRWPIPAHGLALATAAPLSQPCHRSSPSQSLPPPACGRTPTGAAHSLPAGIPLPSPHAGCAVGSTLVATLNLSW